MAGFLLKLLMGKQLDKVKELKTSTVDEKVATVDEEDPEIAEARLEAERRREAKYAKMEVQREEMRQKIRDKYNIKKSENAIVFMPPCEGRITMPKGIVPPGLPDDDDDDG